MVSRRPLYSRIYAAMADRIHSGEWTEGMRLPSEERLRDEFEASRGTVRQALALLRTEGLITGGRGAPPRVQRLVPSQPFDTYISFTEWAESMGREPSRKV
ncbi:GntR family transcriptional regulator, partial [Polaribacter sargassicola]|uniref:GntR family transcriptional regulator n=1 Tax=Polaribacter sargassicola TaxID=2836891 RepID=UPI001F1F6D3B